MAMSRPGDDAETMGESIEWQTPEITATVAGMQGDGTEPWYRISRWPTQEAAIAYIYQLFGQEATASQVAEAMDNLNGGDEVDV